MTANTPLLAIHPLFGDQQNGSHGHQPAADHIEKGSADAAGGGQDSSSVIAMPTWCRRQLTESIVSSASITSTAARRCSAWRAAITRRIALSN